jgi:hypothetical protein
MKIYVSRNDSQPLAGTAQHGSRAHWEARARLRIGAAPGDPSDHSAIFRRNENINAAYAEMYLRNPAVYKWAGMAALTSACVGRGMYIMHYLKQTRLGSVVGLFRAEVARIFQMLGVGNAAVFADIYWQHLAYDQGGIAELSRIYHAGNLDRRTFRAWQKIDEGRRANNQALIWEGNAGLLYFEQKEVLQPSVYDGHELLWKTVSGWITSPILGHHESFEAFSPEGNVGVFEDRWRWIEQSMLPRWQELSDRQPERVERTLLGLIIGGAPFAAPGIPMGTLGQARYQAARRGAFTARSMPRA